MTDIDSRLTKCFQAVFPNLPTDKIAEATLETVPGWDSIASATLLSVASEEFGIAVDFEIVERLSSFRSIREYFAANGAS
jgi:acyl carrier protein